ncbi:MAG: Ig-like domain-containing protein [Solirubrobacterales bacterium]
MFGAVASPLARCAALGAILLLTATACANAVAVTLPGGPLSVSVATLGQCQSSYAGVGNNFYPAAGDIGDCGFFMGFPEAGNPAFLQKKVFGFKGIQGPGLAWQYAAVGQGAVTGAGSSSDPYELITTFKVSDAAKAEKNDYVLIEDTTRYVDGEPQFTSTFDVENVTGESIPGLSTAPPTPLKFHAIYAGDLLSGDSDFATGVFSTGPPREIGGVNEAAGAFGGFVEAPAPSPPWSDYQSGCWDVVPEGEGRCPATSAADGGIWAAVRAAAGEAPVFNDDIDLNPIDNAAGVSWDDHLSKALKPGEHARYAIVNRAQIPSALTVQPATQTHTVQQIATVLVKATDNTGTPYSNRRLVYSIGSANPKSGSVLTDPSGVATIQYAGTAEGQDTVQMYLDLGGSGSQTPSDPASAVQVIWVAATPTPNGRFRLQSVHAGINGAVKIVLVPLQDGTATAEVTEPTAMISHSSAVGAKRRRCKRGQAVIEHRCRALTTVSGTASAAGQAGRALSLTVKPSRKLSRALSNGRTVQLTTKLTYKSRLGGAAATRTLRLTLRSHKKRRR